MIYHLPANVSHHDLSGENVDRRNGHDVRTENNKVCSLAYCDASDLLRKEEEEEEEEKKRERRREGGEGGTGKEESGEEGRTPHTSFSWNAAYAPSIVNPLKALPRDNRSDGMKPSFG